MVKKTTIGKIQLIIGIILLIGGIIGFFSVNMVQNNLNTGLNTKGEGIRDYLENDYQNLTEQSKMIIRLEFHSDINRLFLIYADILGKILLASGFAIILSLLFITQGLANMGGKSE